MEALKTLGFDPGAFGMSVLGFAILLLAFRRFLYAPISEFMANRTREIEARITEAKRLHEEARQQHERLQEELAAEREAARAEIARLTQEAKAAIAELQAEGRRQRQEMVEQGRLEIERSRDAALADLRQTVGDLAVEVSEKLIRESMNEQRQQAMVEAFVHDLQQAAKG